jgi:hypothetical protein
MVLLLKKLNLREFRIRPEKEKGFSGKKGRTSPLLEKP